MHLSREWGSGTSSASLDEKLSVIPIEKTLSWLQIDDELRGQEKQQVKGPTVLHLGGLRFSSA